MSKKSLKQSARPGITLVEVVAGIALLSTLLVSILMAYRAHATQVRRAQDRLLAVELADRLLSQWMHDNDLPESGSQGMIDSQTNLFWRIQDRPSEGLLDPIGIGEVRLEIIRNAAGGPAEVLALVDLLADRSHQRFER